MTSNVLGLQLQRQDHAKKTRFSHVKPNVYECDKIN